MKPGTAVVLVFLASGVALAYCATRGQADERSVICQPWYSATIRMSEAQSQAIKRDLCTAEVGRQKYGYTETEVANCMKANELDHIVPLELAGPGNGKDPNGFDNLQLQPWPVAHSKDRLENEARRAYCAGEITLEEARGRFHRDP